MKYLIVILLPLLILVSCDNTNEVVDFEYRTATIYSVDTIQVAFKDKTTPIRVDFTVINSCGRFGRFVESIDGRRITIELEAAYDIRDFCGPNPTNFTAYYLFRPAEKGFHRLIFRAASNFNISYLVDVR